ncbi:hypothetical protein CPC08DRAFT_652388 [Agrocybe pediades]|nr:hypothetical protein CPC08DRAFT_652388 [Agrocybe pediades]
MSASQFASFAAYTPPPDDPSRRSKYSDAEDSYQSGGVPGVSIAHGSDSVQEGTAQSQWETRYGWRVDILAAAAYVLGPFSALLILTIETHNDFVRFHAYQSALVSTPFIFLRIAMSLAHFPSWIRSIFTLLLSCFLFIMAIRAYLDASQGNLTYFYAPVVGRMAESWLAEE